MAIYADNNGAVGNCLRGTNERTNPGTGWQAFPLISSLSITSGTYYWLAVWSNGNTFGYNYDTSITGIGRYELTTYGSWPNSPTGLNSFNYRYCIYVN